MKKISFIILSVILIITAMPISSFGAAAYPEIGITINGKPADGVKGYLINNTTYVAFRDFFESSGTLSAKISWDQKTKTAIAVTPGYTIKATNGARNMVINGTIINCTQPIRLLNNRIYIPIRPAANGIGYRVDWNSKNKTVALTYETVQKEDSATAENTGDEAYIEDLYWLSRLIHAEAVGQPLNGKIAVGNVVMNRVKSKDYPNTIKDVIFDKKYGTQFSPTENGSIYNEPDDESIEAAKKVLNGYTLNDKIIYFVNHDLSSSNWFDTRTFVFKIGDHSFYY